MQPKYTFNIGVLLGGTPVIGMAILVFASDRPIDDSALRALLFEHLECQLDDPNFDIVQACADACREAREKFGYEAVQVPADACMQVETIWPDDSSDNEASREES